jgi:hypothetical protein
MSVTGGKNTITNGLVFCYDARNVKSFLGEPTVNRFDYSSHPYFSSAHNGVDYGFGVQTRLTQSRYIDENGILATKVQRLPNGYTASQYDYIYFDYGSTGIQVDSASVGNNWKTYTFDYYGTHGQNIFIYTNAAEFNGKFSSTISGTLGAPAYLTIPVPIRKWKRIDVTLESGSNLTGWHRLHNDNQIDVLGQNDYYLFKNVQLEMKSHPTPYVISARPSASGLTDLAGTMNANLYNMSYDTCSQMYFNSSSYLDLAGSVKLSDMFWTSGSWSVSAIVKFTEVSKADGYDNPITGHGISDFYQGLHLSERGGKAYFGFYSDDMPGTIPLTTTKYHYIVFTFDYSVKRKTIYIDGELDNTAVQRAYSGSGNNTTIGTYPWALVHTMYGYMPYVAIYDRVLSYKEIKQNYSILKGIFSV